MTVTLEDINLLDHDRFWERTPYDWFAYLRREAPVWRHPAAHDGSLPPFWCLSRHADIAMVSHDTERFTSSKGAALLQVQTFDERLAPVLSEFIITTDPPAHTALRRTISSAFTPRQVARLEEQMRGMARRAVDAVIDRDGCDFVEIAAELPIQVIAEMMGVPLEDRPKLYAWTTRTFGVEDPDCSSSQDDFVAAFGETFAYALELCAEKRARPTDDILSTLVHAEVEGHQLSDVQLSLFFFLLGTAGNETTRTLIMQGMNALLDHPDVEAELRADRSLLPAAVEEMLRYCSPVHHMGRTAKVDLEIGGQDIAAGDYVVMWYVSGNRDEAVFADPESFDIHRQGPVLHQAFGGGGAHYCLGANLARLEARIMFDELFDRMAVIEQAGPASRLRSNFTHGLKSLPIRFSRK